MALRLFLFIFILVSFSILENYLTRKSNLYGNQRKLSNLLLLLTGTVLSQIFIKLSPVAVSIIASKQGIG
ncbi:hypothetical protein, partial [Halobacteriovorax sp.]|uniref:hypothetical protein n=1 Tax=Halobacteriovorax sp. TaxID=2020862 RepID=UPI00356B12DE